MGPHERETVLMILHRFDRHAPALHRVALLATRPKLPAMQVGVAIRAARPDVAEYFEDMALPAADSFVHSAQRKARAAMIELRNAADGLPARERVAVLARNRQRPVRIARRDLRHFGARLRRAGLAQQKQQ